VTAAFQAPSSPPGAPTLPQAGEGAKTPPHDHRRSPLIEVRGLKKYFGSSDRPVRAVDDVSFAIQPGETLGLVGESGSGKSTIGRTVLRLVERTEGQVLYRGDDIGTLSGERMRKLRSKLQIIFQDPYASLNPKMRISAILGEALSTHGLHKGAAARDKRIAELLETVGLRAEHASRFPHEFSGGQRQRIGVARALAVEPEFIVADEPLSALDVSIQSQVINLLADLRERLGLTMLFISHDLDVVEYLCDRVVVLYLGKVMEVATTDELFARPRTPTPRRCWPRAPSPTRAGDRAHRAQGRHSQPDLAALGLRVPHALPACHRGLRADRAAARRNFARTLQRLHPQGTALQHRRMTMTMTRHPTDPDFNDPLLDGRFKGYPRTQAPRRRSEIGAAGWNVLAGDLPLPLAVLKREALEHNLAWMQARVREWGIDLAPHGKTTMSPQLFQRQLERRRLGPDLRHRHAAGRGRGGRRAPHAHRQPGGERRRPGGHPDAAEARTPGLRIVFLVDSLAQLALIDDWARRHPGGVPFEVMLEIGVEGARTGCRTHEEAVTLATGCAPAMRCGWSASRPTKGRAPPVPASPTRPTPTR
jgi:peptide/nickel transport system ATP-binding protein